MVSLEWIATLSADAVSGVYLEQILNDPLNSEAVLDNSGPKLIVEN